MEISQAILMQVWNAIITLGGIIVAYVVRNIQKDIGAAQKKADDAHEKASGNELAIANHKTHVSENYCDKASMQSTLSRLHDRIDDMSKDIKTLIGKH
jgi:septal ring factor EnvC (AmiA/AmiB activator)